ncbi:Up-regulated during septation-domain-containing protein [Copromyces sp. CBS 386.78]|nr:Up-regulated during septation-domain-containing protein [Copromyces sp. CBS 386.78]
MAHIVSCMLDSDSEDFSLCLNNYIAKEVTPQSSNESLGRASPYGEKPFTWRMYHPEKRYQHHKDTQSLVSEESVDPEQYSILSMGLSNEAGGKSNAGSGSRIQVKEQNLTRRRKVSVPELGPMTTVQEAPMDSPTIPGRPALHERSISAPGLPSRPNQCKGALKDRVPAERAQPDPGRQCNNRSQQARNEARQPLSPRNLTPLVIPTLSSATHRLHQKTSCSRLRAGTTPVESTLRSARFEDSPKARTPFTPLSATSSAPRSAATSAGTASTLPTPISASTDVRFLPMPWDTVDNHLLKTSLESTPEFASALGTGIADSPQNISNAGHKRSQSETGSIMERGRPRKRSETCGSTILKRSCSKRSKSAERRAFEQLPKGWKASDAVKMLRPSETAALQKQALQQAARFEVLRKEDVDNLSKELRQLDERTDYLRRTYTSLRAGRRNLHARICQYLRSPRTAKFSHESMLKQEEALAELDASIDDWITKLDQAENRRTRVRQKLLEHVAAATTLSTSTGSVAGVSESLLCAIGVRSLGSSTNGAGNISTPPRSPAKMSFSPHIISASTISSPPRVAAHVPSTIMEHPFYEEEEAANEEQGGSSRRAETIMVFAGSDVSALLADVENALTQMGGDGVSADREKRHTVKLEIYSPVKREHPVIKEEPAVKKEAPPPAPPPSDSRRKHIHRTMSIDMLNGLRAKPSIAINTADKGPIQSCKGGTNNSNNNNSNNLTCQSATTARVVNSEEIFLTSAVFRPTQK